MDQAQPLLCSDLHRIWQHWTQKFRNLASFTQVKFRVVKNCPHPFAFQMVMWFASASLIVPFKTTVNEKGYIRLKVAGFLRRLLGLLQLADFTAHVLVIVAGPLKHNVKIMAGGGNFTIDGLIYIALNVVFTMSIPYFIYFYSAAKNLAGILNAWQDFLTDYTGEFLREQHVFKVHRYDVKLNLMAAFLPCLNLGVGFVVLVLCFIYRDSPCLMASYMGYFEVNGISAFMLQLIAVAHDAVTFTIFFYAALFIMAMPSKLFFEILFVLRSMRIEKLDKRSLMRVRHQHAVVEVTVTVFHDVMGAIIPFIIWHVLLAAVISTAACVKVASAPEVSVLIIAPIGIAVVFGAIFGLWCTVRLAEDLRSESLEFNLWLEREMFSKLHGKRKGNARWLRANCSMFRRRAVGIRMSLFYQLETGAAMDYVQTVLDKAISVILMTDSSYPITLMFP